MGRKNKSIRKISFYSLVFSLFTGLALLSDPQEAVAYSYGNVELEFLGWSRDSREYAYSRKLLPLPAYQKIKKPRTKHFLRRIKKRKAKNKKGVVTAPDGAGDQKVDHGRIDLKVRNQSGLEEIVTVEIVRPAISAAVVALVTRKERPDRPSQMGDVLVDQISGGLTVMSSIIPPVSSAAGRHRSPTQTPYFRVLEKGERLIPKAGRADDVSWPKPQETAEVKSQPVLKPVAGRRSKER